MNSDQKLHFIYGAMYQMARQAKEEGLFLDLSINEIITLYVSALLSEGGHL